MTTSKIPFDDQIASRILDQFNFDRAVTSIREINLMARALADYFQIDFFHTEFGIPGPQADERGPQAEAEALINDKLANRYPPFPGIPNIKAAASRFIEGYFNLTIPSAYCIPTSGSLNGAFIAIGIAGHIHTQRKTILYLTPAFPMSIYQSRVWGLKSDLLDLYDHRGERLLETIDKRVQKGDVAGILWSSPNNPSWICLHEDELAGIGDICTRRDILAIEDVAYLGMDYRRDYSIPGKEPFIPTVARYTKNAFVLISASKVFSYAGQRVGILAAAEELLTRRYSALETRFGSSVVLNTIQRSLIGAITGSVSISAQYGLTRLLQEAASGNLNFLEHVREYADRSHLLKKAFLANGFSLVYDNDMGQPLSDGFYFTVSYPGFSGRELVRILLNYGISTVPLEIMGSSRTEGIRVCSSQTTQDRIPELAERLQIFNSRISHRK